VIRWFEHALQRFFQFGFDLAGALIRRILGLPTQAITKARRRDSDPDEP
jgi:hypothetical protein